MKIGIRAHDFGCLPPVRLAEKMAAQGVEAAQLAIPKAIAGVESYAQVTDGLLRESARHREHHIDIAVLGCIEPSLSMRRRKAQRIRSAWGCAVRRQGGLRRPRRCFFGRSRSARRLMISAPQRGRHAE
ncbi:MAG: hypothetical protein ACLRZH_00930 [Ruthenibacterium lactatiformans]